MSELQFNKITKYFSDHLIFEDISFSINQGEKVALTGVNGSGKTTIMKLITEREYPDSGDIFIASQKTIGYSEQYTAIDVNAKIFDYVISSFAEVLAMREKLTDYEKKISLITGDDSKKIMEEYGLLREEYENNNGYSIESQTRKVLTGLGFREAEFDKSCEKLSGGEKRRVSLAKLLVSQPDIILLDEPTNHLDLDGIQWLENYLSSSSATVLLISHDTYFLDTVVTRVLELSNKKIFSYPGNYTRYQYLKAEKEASDKKAFEKQQKEIKSIQEYIKKYKAGIKSKQARGREKQLDRRKLLDDVFFDKNITLRFVEASHTGKEVLKVKNFYKYVHPDLEFKNLNFLVTKGETIGIIGGNGAGKTTLINTFKDKSQDKGEVIFGSGVKPGYFDQNHSNLNSEKTIFQEITENFSITFERAREMLASVLFFQNDLDKKIKSLSGGEKARVAFIKLILEEPNLLILDEPSNHLDIESKNIIIKALLEFDGTILCVSHDRFLLDVLATRLMIINKGEMDFYSGSYSEYIDDKIAKSNEKKQKKDNTILVKEIRDTKKKGINIFKVDQRLEELEVLVSSVDNRIQELQQLISNPDIYKDFKELEEISNELKMKQELSEKYLEEWTELQVQAEEYRGGKNEKK